jgi:hypothetical protein
VIGGGLGIEQILAAGLAGGMALADLGFCFVGEAGRHGAGRDEQRRQMAEAECGDEQAGDDLVADAQQGHGFEHGVAERDRRAERDGIAAQEREFHAALALGDAVAHGGNAAGDLGGGAGFTGVELYRLRVAAIGLMGGQHVVIGGDDADIGRVAAAQGGLVGLGGGETMGEVGAAELAPAQALLGFAVYERQIGAAPRRRTGDDAGGDGFDDGVQGGRHDRGFRR